MKLSQHEQQILDEIQREVQAEDPEFSASMTGTQSRRGGFGWGSVTFVSGLVAFMVGAVLAQAYPGLGVCVSVAGFLAMLWGMRLICSGDRAFPQHGQENALRRRVVRFWDSMKDPPPTGMSP